AVPAQGLDCLSPQQVHLFVRPRSVVVLLARQALVDVLAEQDVWGLRLGVHDDRRRLAGGDGLQLFFGQFDHCLLPAVILPRRGRLSQAFPRNGARRGQAGDFVAAAAPLRAIPKRIRKTLAHLGEVATMIKLKVNGKDQALEATPDTPLLWVVRESLGLTG